MFLFLKLCLAHLIADFILQFEELYQFKVRNFWGHILHVGVHMVVSCVIVFPYLSDPFIWVFIGALSVIHLLQDLLKYKFTKENEKNTFLYFTLDQIFHFAWIGVIFFFPISSKVLGFPQYAFFNFYYLDNRWTLYAIFFILLTFGGSYILFAFSKSYLKNSRPRRFITSLEMTHAIFERSVVGGITLFASAPWLAIFTPLIGLARIPWKKLRDKTDFLLSFAYAVMLGFIFRLWL